MPGAVHGSSVGNTSGKRFGANSHDADDANFGVNASVEAVPEIDPAGMASVLALVTGALGLFERRQPRLVLHAPFLQPHVLEAKDADLDLKRAPDVFGACLRL